MVSRDKKQILFHGQCGEQGCFCRAFVFCFASVFSKIKERRICFQRGLLPVVMYWTKVCTNKSSDLLGYQWGQDTLQLGTHLVISHQYRSRSQVSSCPLSHDPLARNTRNNQRKLETQQQKRKTQRIFRIIKNVKHFDLNIVRLGQDINST